MAASHTKPQQKALAPASEEYPPAKDIWIWDEKSGQAISSMKSRERNTYIPLRKHLKAVWGVARSGLKTYSNFKRIRDRAFQTDVDMAGRIGMHVQLTRDRADREIRHMQDLGLTRLFVRFYHHESEEEWGHALKKIHDLHEMSFQIAICLVQDRNAVINPDSWLSFAKRILGDVKGQVDLVQLGQAINRVKWGVWTYAEYEALVRPVLDLKKDYPAMRFVGPSMIDFEYYHMVAALDSSHGFDGLSHLLYVDRRGAPENEQSGFDSWIRWRWLSRLQR